MRSKLRKMAKNKTPEGRNTYTTLRREYKKAIKTAKNEGWKSSPLKLNFQVTFQNLLKVLTIAKIMP